MRIILLLALLAYPVSGQSQTPGKPERKLCGCNLSPAALYRPVMHAIWDRDESKHANTTADGFIRITIQSAWSDPDSFFDIRLNRDAPPTIISYSLPKGTQRITSLIKIALKKNPCAGATALAKMLPMKKRTLPANHQVKDLITQFFTLQWTARRIPDHIRLDTTEYEVEFIGDDNLVFVSDDYETPMVKWIESFVSAVNADSSQRLK